MNCPNCNAECVLREHKGFSGYSCPNCHKSGTLADLKDKPATQMSMYQAMGEKFQTQFLSEKRGAIGVDYRSNECKQNPKRVMCVCYFDCKKKINIMQAEFSCS